MSRIGKMPVIIPQGVQVSIADGVVTAKGPKGQLQQSLHRLVRAEVKDGKVLLTADLKDFASRLHARRVRVLRAGKRHVFGQVILQSRAEAV